MLYLYIRRYITFTKHRNLENIEMKKLIYLLLLIAVLPVVAKAAAKEKFLKGYYIDSLKNKVEGLIAFDGSDCQNFSFKKQLGEKSTVINVTKCSGFGIGPRVFEVIDDIDFVTLVRKRPITKAFAELIETGSVKLYKMSLELSSMDKTHKISSLALQTSGSSETGGLSSYLTKDRIYYYLKRTGENKYLRVETRKSKFKKQLQDYLKDRPEIAAKIAKNKDYSYNNIELIVHAYNEDTAPAPAN